jgi:O-glycosyl hydrolase
MPIASSPAARSRTLVTLALAISACSSAPSSGGSRDATALDATRGLLDAMIEPPDAVIELPDALIELPDAIVGPSDASAPDASSLDAALSGDVGAGLADASPAQDAMAASDAAIGRDASAPDAAPGRDAAMDAGAPPPAADITVDNTTTHQTIAGWGAEYPYEYSASLSERPEIISEVYGTLKLTSVQVGQLLEAPVADYTMTQNSNPDPNVITWSGFQGWQERDNHDGWLDLASTSMLTARQLGLTGYVLGTSFPNVRWENRWLDPIRTSDPSLYVGYVTRELLAYYQYWQNNFSEAPPPFFFGNEEVSGNQALYANGATDGYPGGAMQEMVDLIKAGGQRLAANGFGSVKFIVGSEETVGSSINLATAILSDPEARSYVMAIGYHEYPYGSAYSDLAQVLQASGTGNPPASEIQSRNEIRDLARQYGVQLWLTEVSHASVNGLSGASFDTLRGRAIDIHDNLVYADIASFWLQGNEWDTVAQMGHFGNNETLDQLLAEDGGDMAVIGDPNTSTWTITNGGYALAHYARWVQPGDVRVESASADPLVQVTAFHRSGAEAFVLINNAPDPRTVRITISGATFMGSLSGEQSTAAATLSPLAPLPPSSATTATVIVPGESVTSLTAPIAP